MRFIPPNREKNSPERQQTVKTRLASGLGGIALMLSGYEVASHTEFWTQLNEWSRIGFAAGVLAVGFPLAAELQERFCRSDNNPNPGEDGGNGGGDWPPRDPDPVGPEPSGPTNTLNFDEVEQFLAQEAKALVGV
jgi:hypothetical protein